MLGQILLITKDFSCRKEKRLTWLSKEQISMTEEGNEHAREIQVLWSKRANQCRMEEWSKTATLSPWRTGGSLERMKKDINDLQEGRNIGSRCTCSTKYLSGIVTRVKAGKTYELSERQETWYLHRRLTANNRYVNRKAMNRKVLEGKKSDSEFSWDTGSQSSVFGFTTSCGRFHFECKNTKQNLLVRSQTGHFKTVPTSIYM